MAFSYNERVETNSPSNAGFSMESQKSTRPYIFTPTGFTDLQDCLTDILGTTTDVVTDGRLTRTLPKADPVWLNLFAFNISSFHGIGNNTKTRAFSTPGQEADSMPFYAAYPQYAITVDFMPRPYPVLANSAIKVVNNATFFDKTGNVGVNYNYVQEWNRFTTFRMIPQFEYVAADMGTMAFSSNTKPPNGDNFPYKARLRLPNQFLKVMWYGVPLRYIYSLDSYITRTDWVGRINQNDWQTPFRTFPAGSLLYMSYEVFEYTPPAPQIIPIVFFGQPSFQKLCNVEFTFLYTDRTLTGTTPAPIAKNYIQAGHNLLPWLQTRNYYYAFSADGNQSPAYYSFPNLLLFTDPDTAQNI